jgi:hypothetical protein
VSKHAMAAVPQAETSRAAETSEADELRDATFASLEGRAFTEASHALTEAVNEQVLHYLARAEATGAAKTNRKKLKLAVAAFLADLLSAPRGWVYRSLKKEGFTSPVGRRALIPLQESLRGLGLVEYRPPAHHWTDGFDGSPQALVSKRWASRYRATDKLIALAAKYGISSENVLDHFDYGLPKEPLQKRAASTRDNNRRKVQGKIMKFVPDDLSRKLEADVRELNEYLAKQVFGGGCVHRGYLRIFQNGDDRHFNWDQGGRLYSQPADTNYQQQDGDKRLQMTINGEAVVEIDLRASYLTIFHAWHGKQLAADTDPYVIPEFGEEARKVVKLCVAATFGKITPLTKWPSDLLKDYEEENGPLDRKRYPVAKLREKIAAHHPVLNQWGKPLDGRVRTWADLMFDESRVIVDTMLWLKRNKDVPSLAVHDSLIVAQQHEGLTARTLKAVYFGHLNAVPLIKINRPDAAQGPQGNLSKSKKPK